MAQHQARQRGRYVLGELLGRGGMGEVFAGFAYGSHGFQKPVAIKRLLPALANNDTFVELLIREAKVLVGMQHSNIVSVLDLAREGDDVFLVMEFVDGPSLHQLLVARGAERLPFGIANYIVQSAATGLQFAHDRKGGAIIHADISPGNLLLSTAGEVRVADFGIAKREGRSSAVEGKWAYMAPEQLRGEPLTRRCDVFALGVVLYELLTGRHPFGLYVSHAERLARPHRVVPPRSIDPAIPADLDALCLRALAEDPDARVQTMAELIDGLLDARFAAKWREGGAELANAIRDVTALSQRERPGTQVTRNPVQLATASLIGGVDPRALAADLEETDALDPTSLIAPPVAEVRELDSAPPDAEPTPLARPLGALTPAHAPVTDPRAPVTPVAEPPPPTTTTTPPPPPTGSDADAHGDAPTSLYEVPDELVAPTAPRPAVLPSGERTTLHAPATAPLAPPPPRRLGPWLAAGGLAAVAAIVAIAIAASGGAPAAPSPPLAALATTLDAPGAPAVAATVDAPDKPGAPGAPGVSVDAAVPPAPDAAPANDPAEIEVTLPDADVDATVVREPPDQQRTLPDADATVARKPPDRKRTPPPPAPTQTGWVRVTTADGAWAKASLRAETFDVPSSFKLAPGTNTVTIKDASFTRACEVAFKPGTQTLVVAMRSGRCSLR